MVKLTTSVHKGAGGGRWRKDGDPNDADARLVVLQSGECTYREKWCLFKLVRGTHTYVGLGRVERRKNCSLRKFGMMCRVVARFDRCKTPRTEFKEPTEEPRKGRTTTTSSWLVGRREDRPWLDMSKQRPRAVVAVLHLKRANHRQYR